MLEREDISSSLEYEVGELRAELAMVRRLRELGDVKMQGMVSDAVREIGGRLDKLESGLETDLRRPTNKRLNEKIIHTADRIEVLDSKYRKLLECHRRLARTVHANDSWIYEQRTRAAPIRQEFSNDYRAADDAPESDLDPVAEGPDVRALSGAIRSQVQGLRDVVRSKCDLMARKLDELDSWGTA